MTKKTREYYELCAQRDTMRDMFTRLHTLITQKKQPTFDELINFTYTVGAEYNALDIAAEKSAKKLSAENHKQYLKTRQKQLEATAQGGADDDN